MSGVGMPKCHAAKCRCADENEQVETRFEWRVESESTEDEFGNNEQQARDWLADINEKVRRGEPFWEPAVLRRRTVTTITTEWADA